METNGENIMVVNIDIDKSISHPNSRYNVLFIMYSIK